MVLNHVRLSVCFIVCVSTNRTVVKIRVKTRQSDRKTKYRIKMKLHCDQKLQLHYRYRLRSQQILCKGIAKLSKNVTCSIVSQQLRNQTNEISCDLVSFEQEIRRISCSLTIVSDHVFLVSSDVHSHRHYSC